MKYYFIAGEASGDLHGSNLAKAVHEKDREAKITGWGGDLMQAAGVSITKHYRELAFMGFAEVIKNIRTILKNFKVCQGDISRFSPDVLVLIDYPGFNLRMAKWAKTRNLKVVYYISPQIWAWKENRVHAIKKYVDEMIVILPFEKEFYQKFDYEVHYVGHPLAKSIADFRAKHLHLAPLKKITSDDRGIIALLPGSRQQEISIKLPIMLGAAQRFPEYQFVLAKAPGIDESFYSAMLAGHENVHAVANSTYSILSVAHAALVTSGTATLETALFEVPQVICYKGGNISYQLAKRLIKIKYIGLVNLILDRPLVKELIQHELTEENIVTELNLILGNTKERETIMKGYKTLQSLLINSGDASDLAAKIVVRCASKLPGE